MMSGNLVELVAVGEQQALAVGGFVQPFERDHDISE
jgi:hypothetical protein